MLLSNTLTQQLLKHLPHQVSEEDVDEGKFEERREMIEDITNRSNERQWLPLVLRLMHILWQHEEARTDMSNVFSDVNGTIPLTAFQLRTCVWRERECVCECTCFCMYKYISKYVFMHVHVYMCTCVCVCVRVRVFCACFVRGECIQDVGLSHTGKLCSTFKWVLDPGSTVQFDSNSSENVSQSLTGKKLLAIS